MNTKHTVPPFTETPYGTTESTFLYDPSLTCRKTDQLKGTTSPITTPTVGFSVSRTQVEIQGNGVTTHQNSVLGHYQFSNPRPQSDYLRVRDTGTLLFGVQKHRVKRIHFFRLLLTQIYSIPYLTRFASRTLYFCRVLLFLLLLPLFCLIDLKKKKN